MVVYLHLSFLPVSGVSGAADVTRSFLFLLTLTDISSSRCWLGELGAERRGEEGAERGERSKRLTSGEGGAERVAAVGVAVVVTMLELRRGGAEGERRSDREITRLCRAGGGGVVGTVDISEDVDSVRSVTAAVVVAGVSVSFRFVVAAIG